MSVWEDYILYYIKQQETTIRTDSDTNAVWTIILLSEVRSKNVLFFASTKGAAIVAYAVWACECVFGLFCVIAELMHSKEKFKAEQISRSLSLFIFMASINMLYMYARTQTGQTENTDTHLYTYMHAYICMYFQ